MFILSPGGGRSAGERIIQCDGPRFPAHEDLRDRSSGLPPVKIANLSRAIECERPTLCATHLATAFARTRIF
jgi:hypothetical protein